MSNGSRTLHPILLFLLCNRAGASKEQIGHAIRPEATPSQVRNNLHVSLHYVRKVLGSSDWIVYAEDRCRVHPERSIEFDAETFEHEAGTILRDGAAVDDDRLRLALAHYRGDFLSGQLFGSWHYEWRDRALNSYVALLALLADRCLGRHEYGEATRLYQQLIAREELREDFHRGYMQTSRPSLALLRGVLFVLPAMAMGAVLSGWIAAARIAIYLQSPALIVAVGAAWLLGLGIVAFAVRDGMADGTTLAALDSRPGGEREAHFDFTAARGAHGVQRACGKSGAAVGKRRAGGISRYDRRGWAGAPMGDGIPARR
jgi:hypothetical protein